MANCSSWASFCRKPRSRVLRRIPRTPDYANRWLTFLRNHREAIAAMDFFTVPTLRFGVLYCFFVNGHDRRKILRFNVDPKSQRSLDRPAVAGGVAVRPGAQISFVRSRRKVRTGCDCGGYRLRKPTDPHCVSQPVAERCRRTLGRELPTRPARPRDRLE